MDIRSQSLEHSEISSSDIPTNDFDASPWTTHFHHDPLHASLYIESGNALPDDARFGYDKERGFYLINDEVTVHRENNVVTNVENPITIDSGKQGKIGMSSEQRKNLSKETISSYFHLQIPEAAKELKIGLQSLKKRCREVGISRWPHRKIKSLQTLMERVQEEAKDGDGISIGQDVSILKEELAILKENPNNKLEDSKKKLRQACNYKAKYQKKKVPGSEGTSMMSTNDHDEVV